MVTALPSHLVYIHLYALTLGFSSLFSTPVMPRSYSNQAFTYIR
jgi:hypothetical protein